MNNEQKYLNDNIQKEIGLKKEINKKEDIFNDYDLSVLIYYLTSENKNGKINTVKP